MNTTENLKLQKYDPIEDSKKPFSIEDGLNTNWDIIDEKLGQLGTKEYISKTGDTFTGVLTYTGQETYAMRIKNKDANTYVGINFVNDYADSTKTPSTQEDYMILQSYDSNANIVGEILTKHQTTNVLRTCLRAFKLVNGTNKMAEITTTVDSSGNTYATAPNSAIAGSICTTQNISKSANGYVKLGNGLIICWGSSSASTAKVDTTVSFATSFTASPKVIASRLSASNTTQETHPWVRSISTTQFKWYASPSLTGITWIAVGY